MAGIDVAVVGAPTDDLVWRPPGTQFGPRAIRAARFRPARTSRRGGRVRGAPRRRIRRRRGRPDDPGPFARADGAHVGQPSRRASPRRRVDDDHSITEPNVSAVAARPSRRPRALRHAHGHRHRGVRPGGVPRHADVPARPRRLVVGRATSSSGCEATGRAKRSSTGSASTGSRRSSCTTCATSASARSSSGRSPRSAPARSSSPSRRRPRPLRRPGTGTPGQRDDSTTSSRRVASWRAGSRSL